MSSARDFIESKKHKNLMARLSAASEIFSLAIKQCERFSRPSYLYYLDIVQVKDNLIRVQNKIQRCVTKYEKEKGDFIQGKINSPPELLITETDKEEIQRTLYNTLMSVVISWHATHRPPTLDLEGQHKALQILEKLQKEFQGQAASVPLIPIAEEKDDFLLTADAILAGDSLIPASQGSARGALSFGESYYFRQYTDRVGSSFFPDISISQERESIVMPKDVKLDKEKFIRGALKLAEFIIDHPVVKENENIAKPTDKKDEDISKCLVQAKAIVKAVMPEADFTKEKKAAPSFFEVGFLGYLFKKKAVLTFNDKSMTGLHGEEKEAYIKAAKTSSESNKKLEGTVGSAKGDIREDAEAMRTILTNLQKIMEGFYGQDKNHSVFAAFFDKGKAEKPSLQLKLKISSPSKLDQIMMGFLYDEGLAQKIAKLGDQEMLSSARERISGGVENWLGDLDAENWFKELRERTALPTKIADARERLLDLSSENGSSNRLSRSK